MGELTRPPQAHGGGLLERCCSSSCGQTVACVQTPSFEVAESRYWPLETIPRHEHERAGFCLVLDGGYEERGGGTMVRYDPAMLVFHPAGTTHTNVVSPRGSVCLTVAIDPGVIASLERWPAVANALAASRRGAAHWFAYKLRAELRGRDDLSPLIIDGVALALLGEFARRPAVLVDRVGPVWLERAREQLHDEFVNPPSLASLAESAGVHRVHFARMFRRRYGCTVGDYARQRRIEYASERLARGDEPLSQIALAAGFADQSHFTTSFRHMVGITPRAFRARAASLDGQDVTPLQSGATRLQDTPRTLR